ncbi:Anti-sigma regulatory factor (Ser/Thr protein kinase) [Streptomyces zhaozhouensis]|uniref:Anti-sigma regulatory factor (Ser/Thr protein kinase) n=1 Tax=Streptomyces zhaozhouensis TaxID=1300267 RepID=A0A286DHM4_9ACTN|nr:Anti-sigma regulatory factor (Ser/Thr protein kinase) [Streptomyces zhaozhouensis]
MRVDHVSAVHLAVTEARALAGALRLPGALPEKAAVLASELATNLDKHARAGVLYLQPLPRGGGLELTAADHGPGIADVRAALADGFSTAGTLGSGLGAVRRIADTLTLHSDPDGTLVRATLTAPGARESEPLGAICLPAAPDDAAEPGGARGEREEPCCGDAFAVRETPDGPTVALVDALGHGPEAQRAAETALAVFDEDPSLPLTELLTRQHRALRRSRGAAVALLRLGAEEAAFAAVGNVRLVRIGLGRPHGGPAGPPGIVGYTLPRLVAHRLPRVPGETLLLHTDGIDPGWHRAPAAGPPRLPPTLLAPFLAHRHRRVRDDAAVVAIPT